MKKKLHTEIIVCGNGPVGLSAGIALANTGIKTAIVAPNWHPPKDTRAIALMAGSLDFLHHIGVDIPDNAGHPFEGIRIIDATKRLIRAPETLFMSHEIELNAFGLSICVSGLWQILHDRAKNIKNLSLITGKATELTYDNNLAMLTLDNDKTLNASLIVAADGRHSICRKGADITTQETDIQQVAITGLMTHSAPHHNISSEFHLEEGPLTFVPVESNKSALVWMKNTQSAEAIYRAGSKAAAQQITRHCQSYLGKMELLSDLHLISLTMMKVSHIAQNRVALVGEAAHIFPPIGAQGLNLGFRDVENLASLTQQYHHTSKKDYGNAILLEKYNQMRQPDIQKTSHMVTWLNDSLRSDNPALQLARLAGLGMISSSEKLRQHLMRDILKLEHISQKW